MRESFLALLIAVTSVVAGGPSDPKVVSGSADFRQQNGDWTITTSDKTIINWRHFNIPSGNSVEFVQPGSGSLVTNRVTGNSSTRIDGLLTSNGRVILINPRGITIGPTGIINTSGFIASTLDIPDSMLSSQADLVFSGASSEQVVNLGTIETDGGDVALIARHVENSGSITASGGDVLFAAGAEVLLTEDGRLFVEPDWGGGAHLVNTGRLKAEVKSADNMYSLAVNSGDQAAATETAIEGGRVVLKSSDTTDFYGSATGRFVEVSGDNVVRFRGEVNADTLLLDPVDIFIVDGWGGLDDGELADGDILGPDGGGSSFTISENTLEAFDGNMNITLEATGNLTLQDLTDNFLTFAPGSGRINWSAGGTVNVLDPHDSIVTSGRDISIRGGSVTLGDLDAGTQGTAWLVSGSNITVGDVRAENFLAVDSGTITHGNLYVTGVAWRDSGNPVYSPSGGRAYYPTIVYDETAGLYRMWSTGTGYRIQYATSPDGVNWTTVAGPGAVTGLTNAHHAVVKQFDPFNGGMIYRIWYWDYGANLYSINAIRYAESQDGITWSNDQAITQVGNSVISGVHPDWNRGSYGPGSVLYNPAGSATIVNPNSPANVWANRFVMYYDGTTGGDEDIGLAVSNDGINWQGYNGGVSPVLDSDLPSVWPDSAHSYVSSPTVARNADGSFEMWYSGGENYSMDDGIGYATSSDGINWTVDTSSPFFHFSDGAGWRANRTYTPVVNDDMMWMSGKSSSGTYSVGLALPLTVSAISPPPAGGPAPGGVELSPDYDTADRTEDLFGTMEENRFHDPGERKKVLEASPEPLVNTLRGLNGYFDAVLKERLGG